ncbi:MAG: cysteine rich repeat-containing protein [Caulobacteraceae bacterium]
MNLRTVVIASSALSLLVAGQSFAAGKPKVNEVCLADFHKLCPDEELGRGKVIRCARAHLDNVGAECKSAVEAANASNAKKREAKAAKRGGAKTASSKKSADASAS